MLYGSETWCSSQNEIGILKRTGAITRAMLSMKLVNRMKKKSDAGVGPRRNKMSDHEG